MKGWRERTEKDVSISGLAVGRRVKRVRIHNFTLRIGEK